MALTERPLDPTAAKLLDATDPPPSKPSAMRADDPLVLAAIDQLLDQTGTAPGSLQAKLLRDMVQTTLKLGTDNRDLGELKLMVNSFKELRYAYRVFGRYKEPHKITIFGSARTPEDHPDYTACVEFSKLMANAGWMSITGAGLGIMQAGHVGPGRDASFGVAIRLPFETNANNVIAGDEKLINFRYFFTRKLMFVSQAEAVALFPGGFGTLDEAFETLTLVQTGRSTPMPIVMVQGAGVDYWDTCDQWIKQQLLGRKWISPEDPAIYYLAKSPQDAAEHILKFYTVYHSSRYVRDDFVIRLKKPLQADDVAKLEQEFKVLIKTGGLVQRGPLETEDDNLHLPRLIFTHTKHKFGLIRSLIDRINTCTPSVEPWKG
jgi:uncharacterized protein (TIGR00730 family)